MAGKRFWPWQTSQACTRWGSLLVLHGLNYSSSFSIQVTARAQSCAALLTQCDMAAVMALTTSLAAVCFDSHLVMHCCSYFRSCLALPNKTFWSASRRALEAVW